MLFFASTYSYLSLRSKENKKPLSRLLFHTLSKFMSLNYRGYFIFDFLSVFPGFIAKGSDGFSLYAFKLTRFVHTNRLFIMFNTILVKLLQARGCSKAKNDVNTNKMKVQDNVDLLSLFVFVIFVTHMLACVWCYLGF